MIKRNALFLRKHFLETSKHYEKRVNKAIASAYSSGELAQITYEDKNLVIYYTENTNAETKQVIKGFSR